MKIYKLVWYNEDDYGPMGGYYLIVQAKSKDEAFSAAKSYLKDMHSIDIANLREAYEKESIEDVTLYPIIEFGYMPF